MLTASESLLLNMPDLRRNRGSNPYLVYAGFTLLLIIVLVVSAAIVPELRRAGSEPNASPVPNTPASLTQPSPSLASPPSSSPSSRTAPASPSGAPPLNSSVQAPETANYYVAPNGSSSGDGSIGRPWNLQTALDGPSSVRPGDTIWLRG